jgi:hypothetical protein
VKDQPYIALSDAPPRFWARCRAKPCAALDCDPYSKRAAIRERTMPIDLSTVNWTYVSILAGFVFVATLLGSIISFRNKFAAAIIAAVLFAAAFVFWTYYPRENLPDAVRSLPTSAK